MNKQTYRVIFSRVKGICIAVAESANIRQSACTVGSGCASRFLLRLTPVLVAAIFGHASVAQAQMVAYKNGAGPRTAIDQTANGIPLVQIVTPNASGLSHNRYEQFNVDRQGVILNNSPGTINTTLGGYIPANPALVHGSARTILNEVMSSSRSQLNGYIEVAGQRADVILANPNGITTSNGAGWINSAHVTLTTGTPQFDRQDNLVGFRVRNGDIQISSGGLNAGGVEQLDLIARSITLNDKLWGNQLNLISGVNEVSYGDLAVQPLQVDTDGIVAGIDSSELGGMYAQKITLVATQAGIGVRTLGQLSAAEVGIDSHGKILLAGQVSADGQLALHSDDGISNTGSLYGNSVAVSGGALENSGTLAAQSDVQIHTKSMLSSGKLAAGMDSAGKISQDGNLTVTATDAVTINGTTLAGGNLSMTAPELDLNHATTNAYGSIELNATNGSIRHQGASLQSPVGMSLTATAGIDNDHGNMIAGLLTVNAGTLSNQAGSLLQTGTGSTRFAIAGLFNNTNGTVNSNGQSMQWQTGDLINHYGQIGHAGNAALQLTSGAISNQGGRIASNGQVDLHADALDNQAGQLVSNLDSLLVLNTTLNNDQGVLQGATSLTVRAGNISNSHGRLLANENLNITASGAVSNFSSSGDDSLIASNGTLALHAGSVRNNGTVSAQQNITLAVDDELNNDGGQLSATDAIDLQTVRLSNAAGVVNAAQVSAAAQQFDNSQGEIAADTLILQATDLLNLQGKLLHYGSESASIDVSHVLDNSSEGVIEVNGADLRLTPQWLNNSDGKILHAGNGTLVLGDGATSLVNVNGTIASNGALQLDVAKLDNQRGTLSVQGQASLNSAGLIDNTEGKISSASGLTLQTQDLDNSAGRLLSLNTDGMSVTVAHELNNQSGLTAQEQTGGLIGGNGDVWLTAATLANHGAISAAGSLSGWAQELNNSAGSLMANGELTLTATDLDNTRGVIDADMVKTDVRELNNQQGRISAGQLQLNALNLSNHQGQIIHYGVDAAVIAIQQHLDNSAQGAIQVNSANLTLSPAQLNNQGGSIAHAGHGLLTVTTAQGSVLNQGGSISSNGAVNINTAELQNQQGAIVAMQELKLAAAHVDNSSHGELSGDSLSLLVDGDIDNRGGKIQSYNQGITLAANTLNNAGGILQNLGETDVWLDLSGNLINSVVDQTGGFMGSAGLLALNANTVDNQQGTLYSGQALFINAKERMNNVSGIVQAGGTVQMSTSGAIQNNNGLIEANGDQGVSINSGISIDNSGGRIAASADLVKLSATDINNLEGVIASSDDVSLEADRLRNSGELYAQGAVDLFVRNSVDNTGGHILAGKSFSMQEASAILTNHQGEISAAGNMNVQVASLDNSQGKIISTGDGNLSLSAGAVTNAAGSLSSAADLKLTTSSLSGNGSVFAGQDGMINLSGDYVFTTDNPFKANRDLTITTLGNFINHATLEAGRNLHLVAGNLSNSFGALMNAGHGLTWLELDRQLYNLGRIYGDDIAVAASSLLNDGKLNPDGSTLQAGVIAARNDMDLGVDSISNRDHAVIQSLGNLAAGSTLDSNQRASGRGAQINNFSATIDAGQNLSLQTASLMNTNGYFSTGVQLSDPISLRYFKLNSEDRLQNQIDAKIVLEDHIDKLVTLSDNRRFNDYNILDVQESIETPIVLHSDPARISAGGQMQLAGNVVNDKSVLIAGGDIVGQVDSLQNLDATGVMKIIDGPGSTTQWHTTIKKTLSHRDDDYGDKIQFTLTTNKNISLNVVRFEKFQQPDQSDNEAVGAGVVSNDLPQASGFVLDGNLLAPFMHGTGKIVNAAMGATHANLVSGAGAIEAVQTGSGANHSVPLSPQTVATASAAIPDLVIPSSQLFVVHNNPAQTFVIETDPKFTNYQTFISSDYLLSRLTLDPQRAQKRLGDGFYEQKLINDQITQLTGKRFLAQYSSNEEQYLALMDAGVQTAKQFQLTPGIALSASQMAALTTDMVWLVAQDIKLADGTVKRVLVPVVYLAQMNVADMQPTGSIISARNLGVAVQGELRNGGTITATQQNLIQATDIRNAGVIRSTDGATVLIADNDLINQGGRISGHQVGLQAGRDVVMTTTISDNHSDSVGVHRQANIIDQQAGVQADALSIRGGRDVNLSGAQIDSTGQAVLAAGRDLNLAAVNTLEAASVDYGGHNNFSESNSVVHGTQIHTGGDLILSAGQDINATAAYASSEGTLTAVAGRDVNLLAAEQKSSFSSETEKHSGSSLTFSRNDTHTQFERESTQSVGTTLSGNAVQISAGHNVQVVGGNIVSTQDAVISAVNQIDVTASQSSLRHHESREEHTSGIFTGGGIGVTLGSKQQADANQDASIQHQGSMIGSLEGNVILQAGKKVTVAGSDLLAGKDVMVIGPNASIGAVENKLQHGEQHSASQSGLTLSVTSPIVEAATTVIQSAQRAGEVDDPRLKKLYAAKAAATAMSNYDSLANEASQIANGTDASVGIKLSVGSSHQESHSANQLSEMQGSQILAGGELRVISSGDKTNPQEGNISITGSNLKAQHTLLSATHDIVMQGTQNSSSNQQTNNSSGWNAGVGISMGQQTGITFSASGYQAKGKANGDSSIQSNSHLDTNELTIISGHDVNLDGAVVRANHVDGAIAHDLTISSLQDSETFRSQQQSISGGASFTYGTGGGSASFAASRSHTNADLAAVSEQSGIQAGSGGFDIRVGNHTQLNGGAITSTAAAENNHFSTNSLGVADLNNHQSLESQSQSVAAGTGSAMVAAAKAVISGLAGNANANSSASSSTKATISAGKIDIRNGDTSALVSLNRDADSANAILPGNNPQQIANAVQNSSEAGQVIGDISGQFIDRAAAVIQGSNPSKTYRVVCKQEPCTYDPNLKIDPNRKDPQGQPNVVMVEVSQQDIQAMSVEERKGLVVATNGIMNDVQRAGEVALQNADANEQGDIKNFGNSKPEIILVDSPHSGNVVSEVLVAGYEKFLVPVTGYSAPDKLLAETLNSAPEAAALVGHSRGSLVVDNALQTKVEQGEKNDQLKVEVKGPALPKAQITETVDQLRTSDDVRKQNGPEYSSFPNDPVATFIGQSPNGKLIPSVKESASIFTQSTSSHSCYGTGAAGCKQIEKPFSYAGLDLAKMQHDRQEQVDQWLQAGSVYDPHPAGIFVPQLKIHDVQFQKLPLWGRGTILPVDVATADARVQQLREMQQQLGK